MAKRTKKKLFTEAPAAFITIGLPACGKTTWAESTGLSVIERDHFRRSIMMSKGEEFSWATWDEELEPKVTELWEKKFSHALAHRYDVILADTNLVAARRLGLVRRLKEMGYRILYVFFDIPEEVCRARNKGRGPLAVPDEAYVKMRSAFQEARRQWRVEAAQFGLGTIRKALDEV